MHNIVGEPEHVKNVHRSQKLGCNKCESPQMGSCHDQFGACSKLSNNKTVYTSHSVHSKMVRLLQCQNKKLNYSFNIVGSARAYNRYNRHGDIVVKSRYAILSAACLWFKCIN